MESPVLDPSRCEKGREQLHCPSMGPVVQVGPGPGQLRALGCSWHGAERAVGWLVKGGCLTMEQDQD